MSTKRLHPFTTYYWVRSVGPSGKERVAVYYWVRSVGPSGKERVAVYYCGRWQRDCDEGNRGDVRLRPVSLGYGDYTFTTSPDTLEHEDGTAVFP